MNPLTKEIPKALVIIAGKTLLEWAVERYKQSGITDIVVAVGWKGLMIEEFVSKCDIDVKLVQVPDYEIGPLKTFLAAIETFDGDFLLSPVDALIEPGTLIGIISQNKEIATPDDVVLAVGSTSKTGTPVELDDMDRITAIGFAEPDETKTTRSAMILLANTKIKELCKSSLNKGKNLVVHVLEKIIADYGSIHSFQVVQPWFDVDTLPDILAVNQHLLHRGGFQETDSVFVPQGDTIEVGDALSLKSITIGKGTLLQGPVLIGSNCSIGEHCRIGPNVTISSNCLLSEHCEASDAVIFGEAEIPPRSRIYNSIIYRSNQYNAEI
jgi:NDP-sugar pyrophosphorylase family protein